MALSYEALFSFDTDTDMTGIPGETTMADPVMPADEDLIVETTGRKLVSRQKAVIQEQRLHTLFQILGLTLHELNQPLTSLLGNLELMGLYREKPEKLLESCFRFPRLIEEIPRSYQGHSDSAGLPGWSDQRSQLDGNRLNL